MPIVTKFVPMASRPMSQICGLTIRPKSFSRSRVLLPKTNLKVSCGVSYSRLLHCTTQYISKLCTVLQFFVHRRVSNQPSKRHVLTFSPQGTATAIRKIQGSTNDQSCKSLEGNGWKIAKRRRSRVARWRGRSSPSSAVPSIAMFAISFDYIYTRRQGVHQASSLA